jgi:hypothetical protein
MLGKDVPVLVGAVPLFTVTKLTLTEGYKVAQIAGSTVTQLVSPTTKSIAIEATLIGRTRLLSKLGLEVMALTSRTLAALTAKAISITGLPVVSGMTISLDMQIQDLKFTQSNDKRDSIDVVMTLVQVPRSSIVAIVGEALDLALVAGSLAIKSSSGTDL